MSFVPKSLLGLSAAVAFTFVALLAGCNSESNDGKKSESAARKPAETAKSAEKVRVALGYFPNVTHAQALVGVRRGDFAKAFGDDVDFKTLSFNAGPSVIEAIYAGELDISYIGPSPTLNGYLKSKGNEVRVIAGAVDNGVIIVGSKKRGIVRLDQLKGGRIATPQLGNTQDISARHYVVKELGSSLKPAGETEVLPTENPNTEILFEKDQLDAAWLPEPWASRLISKGLVVKIEEEKNLWPEKKFTLTNVIVRREFLEKHPDLVKKFLEVHVKLTEELKADRHKFAGVINEQMEVLTKKTLPEEVLKGALDNVEFTVEPDLNSFQKFYQWGADLQLLPKQEVNFDELIQRKYLDEVLGAAKTKPAG